MHWGTERGVSEVIGFVIVFGMVMTAFTVYQGVAVPGQNRQAEIEHSLDVRSDLQEVRNAVLRTATTGGAEGVAVRLAPTYPPPGPIPGVRPPAGSMGTVSSVSRMRVENVRALDDETRDHVDGTIGPVRSVGLRYTPGYAYYDDAPTTVFENTVVYARFDDRDLVVTDQSVVAGRRITLVAVWGNRSAAHPGAATVTTVAVSPLERRVAVTNTTGARIRVTLPTRLSAATWTELLRDELVRNGGYVEAVAAVPDEQAVRIALRRGVVYELSMGVVGVGPTHSAVPPAYVTAVEGHGAQVRPGATRKLTVEVRDRFNNPVSGVTVSPTRPPTGTLEPIGSSRTGSAGQASFVYTAPPAPPASRDVDLVLSIPGPAGPRRAATVTLRVGGAHEDG